MKPDYAPWINTARPSRDEITRVAMDLVGLADCPVSALSSRLEGECRLTAHYTLARSLCCTLFGTILGLSLPDTARHFGMKSHGSFTGWTRHFMKSRAGVLLHDRAVAALHDEYRHKSLGVGGRDAERALRELTAGGVA